MNPAAAFEGGTVNPARRTDRMTLIASSKAGCPDGLTISEKMTASALRLPVDVPMPALPSASRVARRARAAAIHVSAEVVSFTHVHTASGFFAQTGSILEPS